MNPETARNRDWSGTLGVKIRRDGRTPLMLEEDAVAFLQSLPTRQDHQE